MLDVSPMQKSGQKNTTISTTFYLNPPNKLVVNSDNTHPLNKHSSDICVLENKVKLENKRRRRRTVEEGLGKDGE